MSWQKKKKDRLTLMQQRFVNEYLIDGRAPMAAKRAGYKSWKGAKHLLDRPVIARALAAELEKQQRRTRITSDRVLEELARVAFSDLRAFFNSDGTLKGIHELDEDAAAVLAGVESESKWSKSNGDGESSGPDITRKIKLWDKVAALEKLGKHFKLFTDRVEGTLDVGGNVVHHHVLHPNVEDFRRMMEGDGTTDVSHETLQIEGNRGVSEVDPGGDRRS